MTLASLPVRVSTSLAYRAWFTPPPARAGAVAGGGEGVERIETDGGDVPAFVFGSGPVALPLHGWGGDPRRLLELAAHLAKDAVKTL